MPNLAPELGKDEVGGRLRRLENLRGLYLGESPPAAELPLAHDDARVSQPDRKIKLIRNAYQLSSRRFTSRHPT